jgi:hypothetical protein
MARRRGLIGWLGLLGALAAGPRLASAQNPDLVPLPSLAPHTGQTAGVLRSSLGFPVPLDQLAQEFRGRAQAVMEHPTLRMQGALEAFTCQPERYFWLLDNPHLTMRLWRFLGAKVTDIDCLGDGRFCWQDGQGSRVQWDTVLRTASHRVWYAEGKVKPGLLLPSVLVKAVLVVHHTEGTDGDSHPAIQHQAQLFLQTDNQAVALAARLLGASAPQVAEQYVEQIEMFYGAMAWYLDQHPKQAVSLLAQLDRQASRK